MSSSSGRFHNLLQREIEVTTVFGTKYSGLLATVNNFTSQAHCPNDHETTAESITLSPPGEYVL